MQQKSRSLNAEQKSPVDMCEERFLELCGQLDDLPAHERAKMALVLAGRLVEDAAFSLAGTVSSEAVGNLIEMSAALSKGTGHTDPAKHDAVISQMAMPN